MEKNIVKTPGSVYTVRFSDCDPYGHLNNSKYIDYFFDARADHLEVHYAYSLHDLQKQGVGFVVASQEIMYIKPVRMYEKIYIQSSIIMQKDSGLMLEFQMLNDARTELKSIMWSVLFSIDLNTAKRIEITGELKALLERNLNEGVDIEGGLMKRFKDVKESLTVK